MDLFCTQGGRREHKVRHCRVVGVERPVQLIRHRVLARHAMHARRLDIRNARHPSSARGPGAVADRVERVGAGGVDLGTGQRLVELFVR